MDNSGVGADGTVQFANTVGANDDLDVIDITGNLNLDAAISNTTSLSVSGTSNLGARCYHIIYTNIFWCSSIIYRCNINHD